MKFKKFIIPTLLSSMLLTSCQSGDKSKVEFSFSYKEEDYTSISYYTDSYFSNSSLNYNSSLATTSLAFAMASFASNAKNINSTYRYKNADHFLKSADFTNIDVNEDFKKEPSTDTFGVIFGTKKIDDYTLIAVGTRGGNYTTEWASNFTLGDRSIYKGHQGFYEASTNYLNSLEDYINKYNIEGKVKLWTVGYSRGGATNNLAVGRIDQKINNKEVLFNGKISLNKEDIYCYCFEPPMGASFLEDISPRSEIYSNIFNIVNPNDLVTKIAPKEFRFTRYGIDYYLPDKIRNINYNELIKGVISNYKKVGDYAVLGEYTIDDFKLSSISKAVEQDGKISCIYKNKFNYTLGLFDEEFFTSFVNDGVHTLDNYLENFQGGLRNIFKIIYKDGNIKTSMMTIGTYFVKYLLNSSDVDLLINTLLKDPTQFAKDITVLIHRVLKDLGINVEQSELYNTLKNLIAAFVNVSLKNIDTFFTLINVDTIKTIALAHYPEICLSHLTNQDKNFTSNISTYNTDGSYYYLEVNGVNSSTNIEILDNNNNTVAKIENGNFIVASNTLTCGTTISDTYYAYFPVEESYNLKISNAKSYSLTYFDQRYENLVEYKKSDNIGSNIIDIKTTTYPERG